MAKTYYTVVASIEVVACVPAESEAQAKEMALREFAAKKFASETFPYNVRVVDVAEDNFVNLNLCKA